MLALRTPGLRLALRRAGAANTSSRLRPFQSLAPLQRSVQTQSVAPAASEAILNAQRLRRPSSPHFTIYQLQVQMYMSIVNRATGGALSAALYAFSLAYLAAPVVGVPFDTAHIVEFVQTLPEWAKYGAKGALAFPFAYHSISGLRHLTWDLTKMMTVKAALRSGYVVLGLSAVSTVGLMLM
ncbi:hypothetical protein BOTBODRAFT_173637 [Botryobasidium botryosum FD-172 SS1]|uniref:Succinate dehydrogenase cytochrome b560 subunit n=1 Tax=Botryobasidium botryosum (strain FD-172 SS1) TaxID=930990 RepID=A0A067MWR2_BOTB1|nr:hypothetical protein BOTBODRAFT_173637 [Botryobasidium botryosum FD-172 SS1]